VIGDREHAMAARDRGYDDGFERRAPVSRQRRVHVKITDR
jgi:hypothetical protein